MCYQSPVELLATILPDPLPLNEYGHPVLDGLTTSMPFPA